MTSRAPGPNRLVIGLGGALLCSLLIIAFLLGRVTAPPAGPAPPISTPRAGATPDNSAPPPPAETPSVAIQTPEPASRETVEEAFARLGSPLPSNFDSHAGVPLSGPNRATSPSPDRQAINTYFARIEAIDDVGAGDPQAFATSMLQSVASGDFSGFDELLARARRQQDRLQGITPPRACVDHHRLALSLSADSVRILENIRGALARGDSAALMAVAAEGGELQTRANQLKSMGEAIKRQAGS